MMTGRGTQSLTISAHDRDRLGVDEHALAEDDQLGPLLREEAAMAVGVDPVGIVLADRGS